jgi:RNA polymerase sigma factor (sigma-70 family)
VRLKVAIEEYPRQPAGGDFTDAAAFNDFFLRNYNFSYSIALGITRDFADAEDVAQSVFCKAWASRIILHYGNFHSWLREVTKQTASDFLRKRSRERDDIGVCLEPSTPYATAGEQALINIEWSRLIETLQGRPAARRDLVHDSFFVRVFLSHRAPKASCAWRD